MYNLYRSFLCLFGFGMLLLGKSPREASEGPPTHGTKPDPSTPRLQREILMNKTLVHGVFRHTTGIPG